MKSYEIFASLLTQRGIKAVDVSRQTGIATSTLSEWKKGKTEPKIDKMQKLADYFNVSLDYMTGKTDDSFVKMGNYLFNGATGTMIPFKDDKLDYVIKTQDPDVEELVQNFNRLPEDLRQNFLNLVKATAKDFEDKP